MIRDMIVAFCRRVGLRVSGWLEGRLAAWPRRRRVLIVLALLGVAWCGWMLGSALYALFNHH